MARSSVSSFARFSRSAAAVRADPDLLCEGFEDDPEVEDSLETRISDIVSQDGKPFGYMSRAAHHVRRAERAGLMKKIGWVGGWVVMG